MIWVLKYANRVCTLNGNYYVERTQCKRNNGNETKKRNIDMFMCTRPNRSSFHSLLTFKLTDEFQKNQRRKSRFLRKVYLNFLQTVPTVCKNGKVNVDFFSKVAPDALSTVYRVCEDGSHPGHNNIRVFRRLGSYAPPTRTCLEGTAFSHTVPPRDVTATGNRETTARGAVRTRRTV